MIDQEGPKAVVFLCECGPIIKDLVDLDALGEHAQAMPDVIGVERYPTLCSTDGKKWLADKLTEYPGARPVFAACTPREHAETLADACRAARVNPYLMGRANIREQCAWVTPDKAQATEKATHLVNAAVARALANAPLIAPEIDCATDVLVVGSGVAGMTAALLLADAGRKVTLVEREAAIGGQVVRYGELYPDMDCAPCLLEPQMDRVLHHPDIEVLLSAEVEEVLGYLGNFTARVKVNPRHVAIDGCFGCRACAEACPVEVPDPVNAGMSTRKAIHIPYEGALPNASVIDESACSHFNGGECEACVSACAFGAISLDGDARTVERTVGAVLLATGSHIETVGDSWDLPGVLTTYEFERILNPDGPTSGEVRLPGGEAPKTVALVHCAAPDCSAPADTCSRTCCLTLAKFAHEISHKAPDVNMVSFTFEQLLGGDQFRSLILSPERPDKLAEVRLGPKDTLSVGPSPDGRARINLVRNGETRFLDADIVVMAAPHAGAPAGVSVAKGLGLDLDGHGFVLTSNPRLRPYSSRVDGIFVAGTAEGQKGVTETASQAAAAAGAVLSALVEGRTLVREAATAQVDADLCGACGLCVLTCPYKAITFDAQSRRARVNELLCHGCGTCAAACPSSAIVAKHFTDGQLNAEIRALSDTEARCG